MDRRAVSFERPHEFGRLLRAIWNVLPRKHAIHTRSAATEESGLYIPAITEKTDKRCVGTGADQRCKTAIQTNNVEVDDRGYIYIVDRANTGMHTLELTGAARRIAKLP